MHQSALEPLSDHPQNLLLASLPAAELTALRGSLEPFGLVTRTILYDVGGAMPYVYFPRHGVISVVTMMETGAGVEAATIGFEGMLGLTVILGESHSTTQCIVQVPDGADRLPSERFLEYLAVMPGLRRSVGLYTSSYIDQVSQSAACNALHHVNERCARWLLQTHDRVHRQDFSLTQEFLSEMLGVNRPTVTIAAGTLQRAGFIRYRRGHVEVLDREGLEAAACECYRVGAVRTQRTYAIR